MSPNFVDAVAVIGMSCRFAPDLDSTEKFWEALIEGRSSVSSMPDKRWDPYGATSPQATAVLRHTTRIGSFLEDIEGFDADFFGITPKEADFLDPQQRLMLELAWEAVVAAGIPPLGLRGTDTGVYMSANSNDYGRRLLEDITRSGAWAVNGTTYYGMANRISYFLDLRGPSMAVDTACAGSLTALHLACQAIRAGEVPVALVGGINVMATPVLFVALDAAGATAPDGRSKAFAADADGYGRGEGGGVVVLKRWADAVRDGDNVLALIRGSGANTDGRSDGMMAPNGEAQEHMLRSAYQRAGIDPGTVTYVEAHGTGTPVGDREEGYALARVFGHARPEGTPCLIGSVKPNIGHTEAASGVAGLIKTILALRHETIPASLHSAPNPDLDWDNCGLALPASNTPWPKSTEPRRAGVSSYGVGGSIAHVIIEEAPDRRPEEHAGQPVTGPRAFPVSAMSPSGVAALAARTADWLTRHPDTAAADIGHTLTARRSHLSHRAVVIAESVQDLASRLRDLEASAEDARSVVSGRAGAAAEEPVVWVFSGHGSQWAGMGQELLARDPHFAGVIDDLAGIYQQELGWTPRFALESGGPWTSVEVQALTYAVQVALAAAWRALGVTPGAVIGHSVGEIAAAVVAGCLDRDEAARFACRRAAALGRVGRRGGMALVNLAAVQVAKMLGDRTDVVAAIDAGPSQTVISGDLSAVAHLTEGLGELGIGCWEVNTDIAFHSPHVDPVVEHVRAAADELTVSAPTIPLYSTADVDPRTESPRDGRYWATNLRQRVRFAAATQAAVEDGHRLFLEVSTHPLVKHSILETLAANDVHDGFVTHTLHRDGEQSGALLLGLAELYCHGAAVTWGCQFPGGRLTSLPLAAWQHHPFWIFPDQVGQSGRGGGHDTEAHTLLGSRQSVSGAPPRTVWETYLDMDSRPYPQDHEVVNIEITPAAVIINSFTTAAEQDGRKPGLSDIVLRTPLAVSPPRVVQIIMSENAIRLSTRVAGDTFAHDEDQEWITHSTASIDWGLRPDVSTVSVEEIAARCPEEWNWGRVDDMFRRMGVGGYAFHWDVDDMRRNETEQLAILQIEPRPAVEARTWAQVIDGALTISAVLVTPEFAKHQWMSSHIDSIVFDGPPPARIAVHSVRNQRSPEDTVDVAVSTDDGRIVCQVKGLRFSAIKDEDTGTIIPRDLVHEVEWQHLDVQKVSAVRDVRSVVIVGTGSLADQIEQALGGHELAVRKVADPAGLDLLSGHGEAVLIVPPVLDALPVEDAAVDIAWQCVQAVQGVIGALGHHPERYTPSVWLVTQGVRDAAAENHLAHAPLWGIGRILAGEHPHLWGGVLDLPLDVTRIGDPLMSVLAKTAGHEDVISLGPDGPEVARLTPIVRPADGSQIACRPGDTYFISGGLGSLGLLTARWLADRGARRLLLNSRRGLPPRDEWDAVEDPALRRQIAGVLELESLGVSVKTIALDVTDADAVAAALDPASHGMPPVRGIVHTAGTVHNAVIENMSLEGLQEAMAAKVRGAVNLHRLFPAGSLDFFVLFSSCGQFTRLTGQGSYAAANSFLDSLAAHRSRTAGDATTSIAWTAWHGVGMSENIATTMLEANTRGLEGVTAAEALRAWAFADRFRSPYFAVLQVVETPGNTLKPPMLRNLSAAAGAEIENDTLAIDWTRDPEAVLASVEADLVAQVSIELNLDPATVDLRRPLVEMGIDSVMTVALRVRLQRRYGLELPPNILWGQPTITALAAYLRDRLAPREDEQPSTTTEPETADVLAAAGI